MHKNTSKHNLVTSGLDLLESSDIKKIKLESIHQNNSFSFSNTRVHDFIKLSKQQTQQYTDVIELSEINLLFYSFRFKILIIFQSKNS